MKNIVILLKWVFVIALIASLVSCNKTSTDKKVIDLMSISVPSEGTIVLKTMVKLKDGTTILNAPSGRDWTSWDAVPGGISMYPSDMDETYIDDSDTTKIAYFGNWRISDTLAIPQGAGNCYCSYTNNPQDSLVVRFTDATTFEWYGEVMEHHGVAEIHFYSDSLELRELVDTYSPNNERPTLNWFIHNLDRNKVYSFQLIVTGNKNPASSGIPIVNQFIRLSSGDTLQLPDVILPPKDTIQQPDIIIPGKTIHLPNDTIPGEIIHEPDITVPGDSIFEDDVIIPGKVVTLPNDTIPGETIELPDVTIPGDTTKLPDVILPGDTTKLPDIIILGDSVCNPCPDCPPVVDCPDCPPIDAGKIPFWVWIVMTVLVIAVIISLVIRINKK